MKLPKIEYPVTDITIPSTGKVIGFRPFLVKEEKILLMARQSNSRKEVLKAVKQIINNCAIDKIDVNKLLIVDIEYLFIQLRAISVNNIVTLKYLDNEDEKEYEFKVDLSAIEVKKSKKVSNKIMINDVVGITLKHGNGSTIDELKEINNDAELMDFYVKQCIDTVFDSDKVWDRAEMTDKDLDEFVGDLPAHVIEKIRTFINSAPKIEYVIEYKNSKGSERKITLNTLDDFFTLV